MFLVAIEQGSVMPVANAAMSKMNYLWKAATAGLTGLLVMTAFETTKSIVFTHLTLWQSHAITILFCTALVFTLSAVFLRREQGKLKKSISFSEGILEGVPGIFYLINERGELVRWNEAFRNQSGYSAAELTRMSVLDFFKEADKSLVAERMRQAFSAGHSTVEASFVAKDQTETPYLFSGKLLMVEGKPCLVSLGTDITERKQAERLPHESESKYRELFENSADAYLLSDEKGFLDCNSAALEMFGYSTKADLIALHPGELSPPNQPDGTPSRTGSEQQIAAAFLNRKNRFEWFHRRKNGEIFPAEVCMSALNVNDDPLLLGIVRDISGRKRSFCCLSSGIPIPVSRMPKRKIAPSKSRINSLAHEMILSCASMSWIKSKIPTPSSKGSTISTPTGMKKPGMS